MKQPRTICANCKSCIFSPPGLKWHEGMKRLDYRCAAVIHDKVIDPVTGDETFVTHEAKFFTNEKHPNCIDMNPIGECAMYEENENVE